jgi:hypothetical protein
METSLNYNYHRDYEPLLGRYIQPDPLGELRGDPHLYSYARNNPLALTDPLGLQTKSQRYKDQEVKRPKVKRAPFGGPRPRKAPKDIQGAWNNCPPDILIFWEQLDYNDNLPENRQRFSDDRNRFEKECLFWVNEAGNRPYRYSFPVWVRLSYGGPATVLLCCESKCQPK